MYFYGFVFFPAYVAVTLIFQALLPEFPFPNVFFVFFSHLKRKLKN